MRRHDLRFVPITLLLCVKGCATPFIFGESRIQAIFGALAPTLDQLRRIPATFALVTATHAKAHFVHGHFKGRYLRRIRVRRADASNNDRTRKDQYHVTHAF